LRPIPLIHPEAEAFRRASPRFHIRRHSVFEALPEPCHVLRSMNIFNLSYFPPDRLRQGVDAVFRSLTREGIWIVGRTITDAERIHNVSILLRQEKRFHLLERIGAGSEIEELALAFGAGCD